MEDSEGKMKREMEQARKLRQQRHAQYINEQKGQVDPQPQSHSQQVEKDTSEDMEIDSRGDDELLRNIQEGPRRLPENRRGPPPGFAEIPPPPSQFSDMSHIRSGNPPLRDPLRSGPTISTTNMTPRREKQCRDDEEFARRLQEQEQEQETEQLAEQHRALQVRGEELARERELLSSEIDVEEDEELERMQFLAAIRASLEAGNPNAVQPDTELQEGPPSSSSHRVNRRELLHHPDPHHHHPEPHHHHPEPYHHPEPQFAELPHPLRQPPPERPQPQRQGPREGPPPPVGRDEPNCVSDEVAQAAEAADLEMARRLQEQFDSEDQSNRRGGWERRYRVNDDGSEVRVSVSSSSSSHSSHRNNDDRPVQWERIGDTYANRHRDDVVSRRHRHPDYFPFPNLGFGRGSPRHARHLSDDDFFSQMFLNPVGFDRRGSGRFRAGIHGGFGFPQDIDNMSYEQLLALGERLGSVRPRGANMETISTLPTSVVHKKPKAPDDDGKEASSTSDGDQENNSCCICMEDFKDGDEIRTLPCFHVFHRQEIDKWLSMNKTCPICKNDIEGMPTVGNEE